MNWPQVIKYLDYVRGSVNTSRAKSRGVARKIEKLHYAFTLSSVALSSTLRATERYQVNYTMPADFRIIKLEQGSESTTRACIRCIRYRIGTTVYRYRLPISDDPSTDQIADDLLPFRSIVSADKYAGELIKANFCIEYWGFLNGLSNNASWTFTTNLLLNPVMPDDISPSIYTSGTGVDRATLAVALPETIPTTYDTAGQWLSN